MRASRRPPNTPGFQLPVKYTLIWLTILLVLGVAFAVLFSVVFDPKWLPLASFCALTVTYAGQFVYERWR